MKNTRILLIVICALAVVTLLIAASIYARLATAPLPTSSPSTEAALFDASETATSLPAFTPAANETTLDTPAAETTSAADPVHPVSTPTLALPTPDPWDGQGRVTILVMGLDYADWEGTDRSGPPRSDTMMLLTIDPASQSAGLLSIPRDLWVSMPGIEGEQKINTAYRFGELYQMPGGGPGLALRTVEALLGVPINFYAVIDFYAFEDFINELGGIEIDVPEQIKVDPIGPDNTLVLKPGLQLLDGPAALAYARNRSTQGGESDRASRQQQVIFSIRDRVLDLEMLPTLVMKAPLLYSQLGAGVRTNLTLEQAIRLAWLAQGIPVEEIQRAAIGDNEVIHDWSEDGQAIFIPIPLRIQALRDQIFTSSAPGQAQGLTTAELILAENARITIVNQTGKAGLAEWTAEYLKNQGLNVIENLPGSETRLKTRLVDHAGNPYTLRYLINFLHVAPSEIYVDYDQAAGTDLTVYLGLDWANDNPSQK